MFVYRVRDCVLKKLYLELINLKHKWIHRQFGEIEHNVNSEYICDYCKQKFRNEIFPAYYVLNYFFTHDVPDIIASLNTFEKILVQRAKAFQTVVKMETVIYTKNYLKIK